MLKQVNPDKVVSILFHPLFIPVYGLAIIFSADSPFGYLPSQVKKLIYIIILINNVLLPVAILPFLMHMNFISSFTMREREERIVPLIIALVLYSTTTFIIYRFPVPGFLKTYLFAVIIVLAVVTAINFRWKISLHASGMGALMAVIIFLSFRYHASLFWYLVFAAIIAGVVLSSRLRLGLHTPRQVWYGFGSGYALSSLVFLLFQEFI